jgi:Uma2 family endonuclease
MPQTAVVEIDWDSLPMNEEEMAEFEARVAELITEDDTPVNNPFSEKQQRLLAETLYTGWAPPPNEEHPRGGRTFWGAANVGLFPVVKNPAIVPDVFLSLDVSAPANWHQTKSYFFWEFGKAPDVVVEIVSNTKGGELGRKKSDYARLRVPYYIVFDPQDCLKEGLLQVFALRGGRYELWEDRFLPEIGIGITLWHGVYERKEDTYLRWCDRQGDLLPTGAELAARESERATRESERATRESERAEKLAARLREMGLNPDQI